MKKANLGKKAPSVRKSRHPLAGKPRPEPYKKQLETALRKFQDIVENLEDMVFEMDSIGRIQYVSPNIERILGYRPEEMVGHIPTIFMESDEAREKYERIMELAARKQKIKSMEMSYIHRDGRPVNLETSAVPFFSEDGTLLGYRGVNRDTTELAHTRRKLAEILESIQDGFFAIDRDWRFSYVNRRAAGYLGMSAEDLVGEKVYEKFPKIAGTAHELHNRRAMELREVQRYEMRGVLTDNWYSISVYPSEEGISVFFQDISERKRAEEALMESEKRYRMLVDSAPYAIIIHRDTQILYANNIALDICGAKELEQLRGKTVLDLMHPEYHEAFFERVKMLESGKSPETMEAELVRLDGRIIPVETVAAMIIQYKGQPAFQVTLQDITERKRAQEAINRSKEELELKVRERTVELTKLTESMLAEIEERKQTENRLRLAQKNLRAMASEIVMAEERSRRNFATDLHDTVVQTLGAAKLRSELLRENVLEKGDKDFKELQDLLSRSIREARQIMTELSPPVLSQFGFLPALEWLAEQTGIQNGMDVKFRKKDAMGHISHEVQVLLFQSTRELLKNVVKHSRASKITVSVVSSEEKIRINVKDDGIGFRGKISFREDYSGFGLFSIRERLNYLGGRLIIESRPGRGTRVTMVTPRVIEGGRICPDDLTF